MALKVALFIYLLFMALKVQRLIVFIVKSSVVVETI